MRARGGGKIVNLSGGGATNPMPRVTAYATSKAAVVRFTESMALELKDDRIDVNAVAPGALATRLLDQAVEAGPDSGRGRLPRPHGQDPGARRHAALQGCGPLRLSRLGAPATVSRAACSAPSGISWPTLAERAADLDGSDIYTLRRIVPEDRGQTW